MKSASLVLLSSHPTGRRSSPGLERLAERARAYCRVSSQLVPERDGTGLEGCGSQPLSRSSCPTPLALDMRWALPDAFASHTAFEISLPRKGVFEQPRVLRRSTWLDQDLDGSFESCR